MAPTEGEVVLGRLLVRVPQALAAVARVYEISSDGGCRATFERLPDGGKAEEASETTFFIPIDHILRPLLDAMALQAAATSAAPNSRRGRCPIRAFANREVLPSRFANSSPLCSYEAYKDLVAKGAKAVFVVRIFEVAKRADFGTIRFLLQAGAMISEAGTYTCMAYKVMTAVDFVAPRVLDQGGSITEAGTYKSTAHKGDSGRPGRSGGHSGRDSVCPGRNGGHRDRGGGEDGGEGGGGSSGDAVYRPQEIPVAKCSLCGSEAVRYFRCCKEIRCATCLCECDVIIASTVPLPPPTFHPCIDDIVLWRRERYVFPMHPSLFAKAERRRSKILYYFVDVAEVHRRSKDMLVEVFEFGVIDSKMTSHAAVIKKDMLPRSSFWI